KEKRVRPAEGRIEDGDGRYRGERDDRGRGLVAEQAARDQRDGGQRQAQKDERRDAERWQPGPPGEQEVLQPEMERPTAALRGDDVEDVPEGEACDPERQLLVDVERRPPHGGKREPDERGRRRDDGGREKGSLNRCGRPRGPPSRASRVLRGTDALPRR